MRVGYACSPDDIQKKVLIIWAIMFMVLQHHLHISEHSEQWRMEKKRDAAPFPSSVVLQCTLNVKKASLLHFDLWEMVLNASVLLT